jgi:hypothetical protein
VAIQGHASIVASLDRNLPQIALFMGPYSVGRWAVAEHVRWKYDIRPDDVLRIHNLDVEAAAAAHQFAASRPARSDFKLIIVDLYGSSSAGQSALVSTLVSPHYARVIIIGQRHEVSPAVAEHAVTYRFHLLQPEEVAKVLVDRNGFSDDRADDLASRAGGQVSRALSVANAEESLVRVRAALIALRTRDAEALEALATKWIDEDTAWLTQWCHEAISDQWRVFEPDDAAENRGLPIRILMVTKPRVRPRLVVRSQLMSLVKGS